MIPAVLTPAIVIDLEQEKRNEALYRARLRALGDLKQPLHDQGDALLLRPYQVEGVEFLVRNQFAILSDDMGLGKTVQSLVAARAYHLEGSFIYVVAPVTLHETWRNEAKKVGVPIKVCSWAKIPQPLTLTPYILIADEAHYAQNGAMEQGYWHIPQPDGSVKPYDIHPETGKKRWLYACQRTEKLLTLAEHAGAVFLLTGTPLKNGKAENLYPLLVAIRHRLTQGGDPDIAHKAYKQNFCDAGNPYRFEQLHDETKSAILRRLKRDCLPDLPEKQRIPRKIAISSKAQAVYDQTFARLQAEYERRVREGKIGTYAEKLVLLNHLRYAASVSKIEATIQFAEAIFEEGNQSLIIFAEFVETAAAIAEGLTRHGIAYIDGSTPHKERNRLVDAFQAGEHRGFVSTTETGGLGLNLQRASNVILVDRPWTPGDAIQAEDRAHRMGQKNAVFAYWLQAHDIDYQIDKRLLIKAANIGVVLGEESALTGGDLSSILDAIFGRGMPCRRYCARCTDPSHGHAWVEHAA